jgi:type I restriction enzyme M protein
MVREALRERFLAVLEALGGSAGNHRLRQQLGWQESTYWAVHASLIDEEAVTPGRGRGGSVALRGKIIAAATAPAP